MILNNNFSGTTSLYNYYITTTYDEDDYEEYTYITMTYQDDITIEKLIERYKFDNPDNIKPVFKAMPIPKTNKRLSQLRQRHIK